ncbi:MAG: cbb3-type cytochrome c oxidase subunit 3 [Proteobacteria bacterium]|nr:cbb3-type cytochrome c oxidase subunit 3 [Pseudomonadota bacterium]MBS0574758.1 cbb3-type cytochrome c oxidase subunit 3 [Pseudomonadota bacterium]
MELYTLLRAFADSWMLLGIAIVFLIAVVWPFVRPDARAHYDDVSRIPFRHDDKPATGPGPGPAAKEN